MVNFKSILKQKNTSPIIPHLFHRNKFVADFQGKATNFFVSQCTVINTGSLLPLFRPFTESILDKVLFTDDEIITHIRGLSPNNAAHGWDGITIRMIQICDDTLVTPLSIINCVNKGVFLKVWKKPNIVPVYKKDSKQRMKNYRPISLLPAFGKMFEKNLFNNLYPYLISNKLISEKQSGIKINESIINQLLYICHEILLSFDSNPPREVKNGFPWHIQSL